MYTGQFFHTGQIAALTNVILGYSIPQDSMIWALRWLTYINVPLSKSILDFLAALLTLFYSLSSMALTR